MSRPATMEEQAEAVAEERLERLYQQIELERTSVQRKMERSAPAELASLKIAIGLLADDLEKIVVGLLKLAGNP